ncbi:MAG: SusC/RagA family TonB-linked outer membrane protein [Bacteroidales bacterium]|nr:SusC/RagA family TonB-linked outer membrane protein [Bacteroidales bacterium]
MLFLFCFGSWAAGQNKITVTGVITDTSGQPLPNAAVLLKGTNKGIAADIEGNYSFTFNLSGKTAVLVYSFMGMESQEVSVSSSTVRNVVLKDNSELEAVVVNGFYAQAKETFTGAATTISGDDLVAINSTNLISSLATLTPGMVITENNAAGSDPNKIPNILIRGANTLITKEGEEGFNNPLIVLDGVEISMEELYDLDIYDIERVDVLKDASATILYGEKGANGVIVVERKHTGQEKVKLSYNFTPKFQYPDLSSFNLTNAAQKLEVERLAGKYDDDAAMGEAYAWKLQQVRRGVDTDWLRAPLRIPFSHNHSLSLSSRGDAMEFRVNANIGDTYGVMKGDNRRNAGLRFNVGYHLRDKLTLSYQSSFSFTESVNSPYGSFSSYAKMNPYDTIYDERGDLIPQYWFDPVNKTGSTDYNPLYDATLSSFSRRSGHNLSNSLNLRWNISKAFYITAQGSLALSWGSGDTYESPESAKFLNVTDVKRRGSYSFSNTHGSNLDGKLVANYGRSLDSYGSMFRISAGANAQYSHSQSSSAKAEGFLKDGLSDISFALQYPAGATPGGSDNISTSVGFFVNGNLGWRNRYFGDLSYRTSGNSRFGSRNSFAPFWAAGLGWNVHNEAFAKHWRWLNSFVLRYSSGFTGSASFNYYQARTVYNYKSDYLYYTGIGALPRQMGNPDLKWQRTLNNNFGLSSTFFDNRLNVNFNVYSNTTYDMVMSINLPPSVGTDTMNVNFGELNNTGLDLSVSGQIIRNRKFFWNLSVTGGHVMDQIRHISSSLKNTEKNDPYDSLKPALLFQEGGSQFDIYAMRSAGIDPSTGKEIFIRKNGEYTFTYDPAERVAVGNTNPILQGTVMNTFRWNGFNLSISTSYTLGGDFYNTTLQSKVEDVDVEHNVDARVFTDRWKQPGDISRYLGLRADTSTGRKSERFVERRNEIYFSSIQFTYDFQPKTISKLGLRKLVLGFGLSDIGYLSTVHFERGTSYPYCRAVNIIFRPTF